MAEDLLPTTAPGMVSLREKKTKKITQHFPVDAREVMTISPGEYEIVQNGAIEAARMNANPLTQLQDARLVSTEVTGIEGQVMVAMSTEEAEQWRAKQAEKATQEKAPAKALEAKAPAASK